MTLAASCAQKNAPRTFEARRASTSSGVWSSAGFTMLIAALFTMMFSPPWLDATSPTSAETESASPTSQERNCASRLSFRKASSASSPRSCERPATTTLAPASASALAIARPIPDVPPVTIATRPSIRNCFITVSSPKFHSLQELLKNPERKICLCVGRTYMSDIYATLNGSRHVGRIYAAPTKPAPSRLC